MSELSGITENSENITVTQALLSNQRAFSAPGRPDSGSLLQVLAALLWLPQAAALAWAVQQLADGVGLAALGVPLVALLLAGLLRSSCDAWGARRVFLSARAQLAQLRMQVVAALAARSPLDRGRPASGLAASVVAEQAEAVVPWLVRYQPARWRVVLVLPLLLLAVGWVAWVPALVLLLAAPLIPLFMALVGWRAQAASAEHLQELGDLNAFLLDRRAGWPRCAPWAPSMPRLCGYGRLHRRCASAPWRCCALPFCHPRCWSYSPHWAWRWWRCMWVFTCWERCSLASGGSA